MFENIFKDQKRKDFYSKKTFVREIDLYLNWMQEEGYTLNTLHKRLFVLSSFSDYLSKHGIKDVEAMPEHASLFVTAWVRNSKRKERTKDPARLAKEVNGFIRQFLRFLVRAGVLKPDPIPVPTLDFSLHKILTEFVNFCRMERGLAESTISLYSLYVRRFLLHIQRRYMEKVVPRPSALSTMIPPLRSRTMP